MDSSKRQTTPWTKIRKKPGPKKKEVGEHFDESKKKKLATSDKGSWFDQPSSDVSAVSHPSTSREEVGASTLKADGFENFYLWFSGIMLVGGLDVWFLTSFIVGRHNFSSFALVCTFCLFCFSRRFSFNFTHYWCIAAITI